MRQRAAAATVSPPRSGDSQEEWQHGESGQWHSTPQPRHRNSYQQQQPESRSLSVRQIDVNASTSAAVDGIESGAAALASMEGATRRRRTSVHPLANQANQYQTTIERHSPQHYLAEYNKNYSVDGISPGAAFTASSVHESSPAPHSVGGTTANYARSLTHGATGYSTASEVYYNQYANHHPDQHPHIQLIQSPSSSYEEHTPRLRRNNSVPNAHKLSFQHFEKSFHMDPNPLAAVHFRRALHVPDSQYREFVHGHGRDTTPLLNPICCANACAGFSCVGFLFLVWIGYLLDTQPIFISGTLPSALKENDGGKTTTIYFVTAERLPSASHAYQASYAYFGTMMACLIYVYYERLDSMIKRRAYQELPDATSSVGGASNVGVVGEGLPETVPGTGTEPTAAYHVTAWNRLATATFTMHAREWAGTVVARMWNGRGPTNSKRRKMRTKTCAKTV
jgi:hypothetical protein